MTIEHVLAYAFEEVAGAAIVLDASMRVVLTSPSVEKLMGTPVPVGTMAPAVLCGTGPVRPVAEALASGKSVVAELHRTHDTGEEVAIKVRATPLHDGGNLEGFLLLLSMETLDHDRERAEAWGIITRDPEMKSLLRSIRRVADSEASVLVRGETGAGKELVAQAIHLASPRAEGPFRAINCAALPAALLESELFGHVRGAFTGAVRDAPGHLRLAEGGTLFLDEVAELPIELQAKMLRVLQERTIIPVGGRDPIPIDVRLVSATHRSLRQEVLEGRFRADLMYRLRVVPLYLPPLRDRPDDVELLAWHFVERRNRTSKRKVSKVSSGAVEAMRRYEWPGNVRELDNAIEYAFVMGDGAILTDAELPPEVRGDKDAVPLKVNAQPAPAGERLSPEARKLLNALNRAGGHHGRAAASLGISRTTLWRRLRKHGLETGEEE